MNETDRERSLPLFFLISMGLHALLFLYAPQIVAGLIPSLNQGDQGGVTLITLIDVLPPEEIRAAVSEAARQPQSRPEPRALPEPQPQVETVAETPSPQTPPQPVELAPSPPTPTPRPEQVTPEPVEQPPVVAPEPQVDTAPTPQVAPAPADRPEPTAVLEPVSEPVTPTPVPDPVLTSDAGRIPVPQVAPEPEPAVAAVTPAATPVEQGEVGEASSAPSQTESEPAAAEESGTASQQDVTSAAPEAQIAPEPELPPTGVSMIASFGSTLYPKNVVGLLDQPVTVEVAAVVSPDGTAIAGVLMDSSGIAFVDNFAYNIATQAVRYRPHTEVYEVSIFVTFDPVDNTLTYRVSDFIRAPQTTASQ